MSALLPNVSAKTGDDARCHTNRFSLPPSYLLSPAPPAPPRHCPAAAFLVPGTCARGSRQLAEMALQQAPASSLARAPAAPPRSSFSAPWPALRQPAPARRRAAASTAARIITMRVASKQAYICRDCG